MFAQTVMIQIGSHEQSVHPKPMQKSMQTVIIQIGSHEQSVLPKPVQKSV